VNRRNFVTTTTAVVFAGVKRMRPARAARIEHIGLQLYTVRHEMERDMEGTLARVAQAGYTEVEFAGYFDHAPKDVRAMLDRHGLVSPSFHTGPIEGDPWHAALDAAHVLGQRYVIVAWIPPEQRTGLDAYKRFAEHFNKAAEEARAAGLQFGYHNHDFEFAPVGGRLPYDVLLAETDPKLVQFEMDLYWITKGGQDPLTYFARYPGRFPLVHVKDSMGPPEHKMADVGAGTIDWKRIFAQHEQAGIRHYFVEHDQPQDPFRSIQASCDYLKRLEF
jgi:sugar phosphate isomerase/epimerase